MNRAPRESHRPTVTLRDAQQTDFDALFAWQDDPAALAMAMLKPRSREAFEAGWNKVLSLRTDPSTGIAAKLILADDQPCGSVGTHVGPAGLSVGYLLAKSAWGRGIASQALGLFLREVRIRPLHARVASSNKASIRVLEKHGFVVRATGRSEETERYLPCDEIFFVLT